MVMMMMINYLNFSLFMHCLSFRELLLQTEKLGIWNLLIIGSVKGKKSLRESYSRICAQ